MTESCHTLSVDFRDMIAARRDGVTHSPDDLRHLAYGAAQGSIPDYQLSAWLMAAVLKPLSLQETAELTMAMAESGDRLDLSGLPKPWVDKHSTGGVGDKTTLALLPLLSSCGLTMVKMSGRGLGITGGTIDKLESVPGFRTDLSPEEMIGQAKRIGIALTGQTPRLAPADGALYALRDATATVQSMPLIASSILSKKIAGGAETIVIDLKCGSGAFMANLDDARRLGELMMRVAEKCGIKLRIAITDMDEPLGFAVGNLLEVSEALSVLRGELDSRFAELCLQLAGLVLAATGRAPTPHEGERMARKAIAEGRALQKAQEWFAAQGVSAEWWAASVDLQIKAAVCLPVRYLGADRFIHRIDARKIGEAAVDLGAGRKIKTDQVKPNAGIRFLRTSGPDAVRDGETLCHVFAEDAAIAEAVAADVLSAFEFSEAPPAHRPVVIEVF
jgi:pyrimidine-nucleoside phosphorylase